jgi:RNA polymerase sigma-54 factor
MQLQRTSFIQEQRLRMNPQLYQSIRLMELPVMDLREKIEEELERNPALELVKDRSTIPLDAVESPGKEIEERFETSSDPGGGVWVEREDTPFKSADFIMSGGIVRQGGQEASDEHRRFLEGVLSRPETLQQHLLWQLRLEPVDDELRGIAEILIQNLDDDGFHKEPPETLFKQGADFPETPPPRLAEAIQLVRTLDPAGTCTANYKESLQVQIDLTPSMPEEVKKILDHFELLERGKFLEAAKKTGLSEDEARDFFERIKELSPFPGRNFTPGEVRYVIPEIQVVRDDGEFKVIYNNEAFPELRINKFFKKLAAGGREENSAGGASGEDKQRAREFGRENVRQAQDFFKAVKKRRKTLLMVARAILRFQRAFFMNGPKYLAPLTLADIAKELEVHETTVSRTANGKYMQTEWGIFEIRHFFTNSISGAGSGGSRFSKEGVKATIQEIITAEKRKLSDQDISDVLARRGISLARRTVAKYRNELDMGSSYTR